MLDLAELPDRDLAAETRRRETDYQAALAETHRRGLLSGRPPWSEEFTGACLERRRHDPAWHPNTAEGARIQHLPPPIFRMGWEWCALSIMSILDSVLEKPSDSIAELTQMQPAGRGLYRPVGKPVVRDERRRGAYDLIQLVDGFLQGRTVAMLVPLPPKRRSDFVPGPGDDPERASSSTKTISPETKP